MLSQINDIDAGYNLIYNTHIALGNKIVRIKGVVKEKEYKVYINELYRLELLFGYSPDIRYGVQVKDGEVLVPVDSYDSNVKTKEIEGKTFNVTPSDKVDSITVNSDELRAISQRFSPGNYWNSLYIIFPQADEMGQDIIDSGIAENVSSRALDNKHLISRAYNGVKHQAIAEAIMLVILLVMSFIMFYASLAARIKELGLYRAIRVSAKNIVYKFFVESFAFIIVAVVSVYLLIGLPILILSSGQYLYLPVWLYFASFGIVTLDMMLASALPILFYIRKTPVQILSKYDL